MILEYNHGDKIPRHRPLLHQKRDSRLMKPRLCWLQKNPKSARTFRASKILPLISGKLYYYGIGFVNSILLLWVLKISHFCKIVVGRPKVPRAMPIYRARHNQMPQGSEINFGAQFGTILDNPMVKEETTVVSSYYSSVLFLFFHPKFIVSSCIPPRQ